MIENKYNIFLMTWAVIADRYECPQAKSVGLLERFNVYFKVLFRVFSVVRWFTIFTKPFNNVNNFWDG